MISRFISSILLIMMTLVSQAQVLSNGGRFNVSFDRGCSSFDIELHDLSGLSDAKTYFYADGSILTLDSLHTYTSTTSSIYTLEQTIQNEGVDEISISVFNDSAPSFNLYNCTNDAVYVAIDTNDNYQEYYVDFGDGATGYYNKTDAITHQYASQGTYNVTVKGLINNTSNEADSGNTNCAFQALSTNTITSLVPPVLDSIIVNDAQSINLYHNLAADVSYDIEYSINDATNFNNSQYISNLNTSTITGLDTETNSYAFRLVAQDFCNGGTAYSSTGSSILLQGQALSQQNDLNWTVAHSSSSFDIEKNNASLSSTAANSFTENNIPCNQTNCYQIISNNNSIKSISNDICLAGVSTDTPPSISHVGIITEENNNGLWILIDSAAFSSPVTFKIYDENYQFIETYSREHYIISLDPDECFYMDYTDACENTSLMSRKFCPLYIPTVIAGEKSTPITWNEFTAWSNTIDYYDFRIKDGSNTPVTDTTFLHHLDSANQSIQITVIAYDTLGLLIAESNVLSITYKPIVNIPSAFTPDGDGLNDNLEINGSFIRKFNLQIYNRWGELIFESENINNSFDGRYKNKLLPQGTYTVKIDYTDYTGKTFTKKGAFVLLNK